MALGRSPRLSCRRVPESSLVADADAAPWATIEPVSLVRVATGAPPDQATMVRVAWDGRRLRLLYEVADNFIVATLSERDAPLYTEEVVEVFLDPVGDAASYFEIELNPLNAVLDLVLRRNRSGYKKDFQWACEGLETLVRRSSTGWIAEMAIPFSSLSAEPPQAGAEWKVNFARIDRPPGVERELTAWSPTGLANFHVPERFGTLVFE